MYSFKSFALASSLGLAMLMPLQADQWNKKTIMTVDKPIQVPGKVLPPGKYVMKLMDSPSNRHIVQIFDGDEKQLQTTVLAIPNYRLQPTGDTQFGWWETPAGQPQALRSWFYPGDNFGQEFAYPKNEAAVIATATSQTVPVTYSEKESDLATSRVGTVDRAGTEQELDRETYDQPAQTAQAQPESEPKTTEMAQATPPPQATPAPTPAPEPSTGTAERATPAAREKLPSTASPFPAIGLMGLIALGAAATARLLRRA